MVTFIVDGFDPWNRVELILRHIQEIRHGGYEVIVMASLLLDADLDKCESRGRELLGSSFRLVKNDAVSIFASRLRAQRLANGAIFFYISPTIAPQKNIPGKLLDAAEKNDQASFYSAPLAFAYPGGKTTRILAHGYSAAKNGLLAPVLLGETTEAPKFASSYNISVAQPYCFCSHRPFYSSEDGRENFWRSHLAACARHYNGGESIGGAITVMYPDAFVPWIRLMDKEKYSGPEKLSETVANNDLRVEATAYGQPRVCDPGEKLKLPAGEETEEDIFWGLLRWQMPQFIAASSQKQPALPLLELARESLVMMASTTFEDACKKAGFLPRSAMPDWQTFSEWFRTYEPIKNELYARPEASFYSSLKNAKNIIGCLKNLAHIGMRGLLGLQRKRRTC